MFTQITTELDILVATLEKKLDLLDTLRASEYNPNVYAELGGRLTGVLEALQEVQMAQVKINDHIIDILKNTTDGSYAEKLGVLEDENRVLRDKIYVLENDLKKMGILKKRKSKTNTKLELEESIKELDENTINEVCKKAYEDVTKDGYNYDDSEEE